jgi:predicted transcriptional regulator
MSPASGSDVDFRLHRAREDIWTIPPGDPDGWMAIARHRPAVLVPGLGPLESAVMTAVWNAGEPLTVRGCRGRLDYEARHGEPPTYSTVMTIMVILWRKGLLSRAKGLGDGHPRAFWYQARVTRENYLAGVIGLALCCTLDPAALLRRAGDMARILPGPPAAWNQQK